MTTYDNVTLRIYNGVDWDTLNLSIASVTGLQTALDGKAIKTDSVYYVEGNTSGTAGQWTGSISAITALYNGLTIRYRMGIAGADPTYLNINGYGNKQVYRYAGARHTTHWPAGSIITLTYRASENLWYNDADYDSTDDYNIRWQGNLIFGEATQGYHLLMEGIDGRFIPVTSGGNGASTTNTISSAELRPDGLMIYYGGATDYAANATGAAYYLYESIYSNEMEYWSNKASGWAVANKPFYIVCTINANGNFVLDGAGTTGNQFLTQTLPTTDDGKYYIQVGFMHNTYDAWRLDVSHPIYQYKDGKLRLYVPAHTHSASDIIAGTLDVARIPNIDWSKITTGKPTTLAGYGITDAQAADPDLTAIAALAGTTGFLKKTAANTWTLDTNTYLTAVPAAQSPNTATELSSAQDLNTLFTAGFYYQTANADTTNNNYPSNEAGSLIVQKSAGQVTQMYITYDDGAVYTRSYYTSWSAWQLVYNTANVIGAVTTVMTSNLTADRVLISDGSGKISQSAITPTKLGYLTDVTSNIQAQLNGKQATLTNPVTGTGLTNEIAYWASASTIASLPVATYPSLAELAYVKGVTSAIQTQLNGKQATLSAGTLSEATTGTETAQRTWSPSILKQAIEALSDLNTNNYPTALAFATATGILTLSRSGLADLTVNLDGRYLTSETSHADVLVDGDATTAATANKLLMRDGNGYAFAVIFNQSYSTQNTTVAHIMTQNGTDGYIRPTSMANLKTAMGLGSAAYTNSTAYQAADADLAAIAALAGTSGFLKKTAADTWTLDTNTYLTGNQTITLSGDVTGSGATAITATLANSGVSAGTYKSVTVDAKGRVTAGSNPTTLAGYGITDAQAYSAILEQIAGVGTGSGFLKKTGAITFTLDTNTYITGNQTITVTGDVTGSGATAIALTLANSGVTAGTYKSVTVDAKGRVTAGSNPTTLAGYGITDAASSTHVHGDISNGGQITAAAITPLSGDYILLSDGSNSGKIARGIAIGDDDGTFLKKNGTWAAPVAAVKLVLASDYSTTSTTMATPTGMGSLSLTAGKKYRVTFWALITTAASTTGVKFGFFRPSGTMSVIGMLQGFFSTVAHSTVPWYTLTTNGATGSYITTPGSATAQVIPIRADGIIDCTVSGSFALVFGSEVASSSATIYAGATLMVEEI